MILGSLVLGGRLDRYVARLFVLSYLAAFFLVVGLFLVIDMATNLDDYLAPGDDGSSPPFARVVQFYGLQLPFLYLQMSPYVTLVAGLFTAARLTRANEVVAVLNAGVSGLRAFLPLYAGALALAAGMFGLRELATGELGARRDALHDYLKERREAPVYENFFVPTDLGAVRIREYHPAGLSGGEPRIEGLSLHDVVGPKTISIVAAEARPSGVDRWELVEGRRLVADASARRSEALESLQGFSAADIELAWKGKEHPLDLSFSECVRLLARSPDDMRHRTLLHYYLTFPLAGFVLLLVGLPFLLSFERGRAGERIAKGFFLCIGYFAVDFVTRTLGLQGQIGPLYAAWLPVLFFGSLGVVLTSTLRT